MRPDRLSLALACLLLPLSASAEDAPEGAPGDAPDGAAVEFDRIVVTATRTGRVVADVPHTVDLIDRERMDERVVRDLQDLFRYEPGITVGSRFGRFGIGDIRIRGLGGNRVRIQTDGIPVPDAFEIGSFSNAGRNVVDLDTLKRVEVVRGPASSLYGSDALGGVVSFVTRDPGDYLDEGRGRHVGIRLGYEGDRDGLSAAATLAAGNGRWSGLVVAGHRQGREPENMGRVGGTGGARTRPNPQSRDGRSLLAKLVFEPRAGNRLRLAVEGNEDHADTDMLTAQGLQPLTGATHDAVRAHDHQARARVALSQELELAGGGFADAIDWQVYRQDSETTQYTFEARTLPAPAPGDLRERWFNFDQRVHGLQLDMRKALEAGGVRHDLAWGLEAARTRTRQKRDGRRVVPSTGQETPVMLPDVFPVRDFPNSTTTRLALYLQDEMSLAGGDLRLVPALRVDHYDLDPRVDPIFAGDNPGVAVTGLTHSHVSPKLGAVWHVAPRWSLFASYAHGFRAPPYSDVNIGFTNAMFGYTAIANPGLRPETSDGLEAGLRYSGPAAYASLAAYSTRYDDFIESLAFVGFNDDGLMVFQSRNVSEATIRGVELKAGVELGRLSPAWEGWSILGAAAWSRGEDETLDEPLATVDPPTATLGLAWRRERWGLELAGRFAGRRDRLPEAPEGSAWFAAPGHAVFDLYAHVELAPGATLDLGLLNLGDRRYWTAGALPLAPGGTTTLDRYTAPGRSLAFNLALAW